VRCKSSDRRNPSTTRPVDPEVRRSFI
jgi:hypothetical protein